MERYPNHAANIERVKQGASALQRGGYLLEKDVARMIGRAASVTW